MRTCWTCVYAEICNNWQDVAPYNCLCLEDEYRELITFGLCKGRHPLKVEDYVFDTIEDPSDVQGLEDHATLVLARYPRVKRMNLYVTGLSMALVAVINVCHERGIDLTLWHYNVKTGKYFPQSAH